MHPRRKFLTTAGIAASAAAIGIRPGLLTLSAADAPDEILNPVEVSGEEAVPIVGKLPGARRMYILPSGAGEHHIIGSQAMTRVSRAADTGNVFEMVTFSGRTGSSMPRHLHRGAHAAFLVMAGEVELELNGEKWIMMRGDFANIPPGTPHSWTMRSDRSKIVLYTMNDRVGSAFTTMGAPAASGDVPAGADHAIRPGKLADAAFNGDFQLVPNGATGDPVRVTNLMLPATAGPYVILDGGGERFGGNTFLAKNANSGGQFLFIMTEGGASGGVPAHFHARHFENFLGMDGETLGWAHGKAASLKTGDYFQAPPRNLHGFKLTQSYNRFAAFLSPGIFENFFTGGKPGQNGVGRNAAANPQNFGGPGGEGRGAGGRGAAGGRGRGGPGGGDMFRQLMMSNTGPDGYPLDVHGPTLPLPPQDPVWTAGPNIGATRDRMQLLAHGLALCGSDKLSREITPELRRALKLKPKAEDFV